MKIIILGTMRTRSSYLLSALITAHNLISKWEPYDELQLDVYNNSFRKEPDVVWSKYKIESKKLTEKFMTEDNFALKLFSHAFFNNLKIKYACKKNKPFVLVNEDSLDLEENIQISKYDQIYFLTRKDYINNICSFLFGAATRYLYLGDTKHLISMYNKPIVLSYDKTNLQSILIQQLLLPVFENKLIDTRMPYIKLDYEELPEYVNKNYPSLENHYTDPKFDYKYLIKNYDEILNVIEEEKIKFQPLVDDLLSK